MFVDVLSEEMLSAGEELTKNLDMARIEVSASLWLYLADLNVWRLIIASPEVRIYGPKNFYKKVQSIISKLPEDKKISLKDVAVVDNNDSLISLLRTAIKTGKEISRIRFSRNTINGVFIEDAYIYRLT